MPAPYVTPSGGTWAQVGQATVTIPTGGTFTSPVYSGPVVFHDNNTSRIHMVLEEHQVFLMQQQHHLVLQVAQ